MDQITALLDSFQRRNPHKQLWLAVSGGVDSMVLMHAYAHRAKDQGLETANVVYVDHNLHKDSESWGRHVLEAAKNYGLAAQVLTIQCDAKRAIEETARERRYQAIFQLMDKDDLLLTAHHFDDQKETFMFRALRGTGITGLKCMTEHSYLYGYQVGRPLLTVSQQQIHAYALKHNIQWVEDSSNTNVQFSRNAIRSALSHLQHETGFLTTQAHIKRQLSAYDELLIQSLKTLTPEPHILNVAQLKEHSAALQQELFYHWLKQLGAVSHDRVASLLHSLIHANQDKYPSDIINGFSILRYRDFAVIIALPAVMADLESSEHEVIIPQHGRIINPLGKKLSIKKMRKVGRYKKKFQQLGIPAWLRQHIPLVNEIPIFEDASISWVPPKEWRFFIQ